jgi:hypothetical protein
MINKRVFGIVTASALLFTASVASAADMNSNMMNGSMMNGMDRFGGPVYEKSTDLPTTIALINAGGGPGNFSAATALTALVGAKLTNAEIAKLSVRYGKPAVDSFITVFNFAVNDAAKIAKDDDVKFPAPALSGEKLASQIVQDGTVNNTFYTGYMLDHLVTHKIHDQVMGDIDAKFGAPADANYHKVSNQAFYDIAQALGDRSVAVATLH